MPSARSILTFGAVLLQSVARAQLNQYAQGAGLQYFGSGTTPAELSDSDYSNVLGDNTEFGAISGNQGFDWQTVEGGQGQFDYSDGDGLVQYAVNGNQLINCGPIIQYDQLPTWGKTFLSCSGR
jgi:endo-1,4-beta-xylanase